MSTIETFRSLNFGDCEVEFASFGGGNLRLAIVDEYNNKTVTVEFSGVCFFFIESDHPQNIISEIVIFENYIELFKNPCVGKFIKDRNIEVKNDNSIFAYVMPIAGFEAFVIFNELQWSVKD